MEKIVSWMTTFQGVFITCISAAASLTLVKGKEIVLVAATSAITKLFAKPRCAIKVPPEKKRVELRLFLPLKLKWMMIYPVLSFGHEGGFNGIIMG